MNVEKLNINTVMIQECTKFVKKEGTPFQVVSPEVVQEKEIRTVAYRIQAGAIRKIEFVTEEDIEACLDR